MGSIAPKQMPWEKKENNGNRPGWLRYSGKVRKQAEKYGRWGISRMITDFNAFLETTDWNLCHIYILLYFEEYEGKMPIARDNTIYMDA